jgi:predicted dehydrogenase
MSSCDRIMGGGKWRTEQAYNPCAGGLSHNFMTALLFSGSPIARVRATGRVLAYKELEAHGGYDTMEGTLEFANGRQLSWNVCLATTKEVSPFRHRTVSHTLQFEHGSLTYGPSGDQLNLSGVIHGATEPEARHWRDYNIQMYRLMHRDLLASIGDENHTPRHTIEHGLNVAWACLLAFESAKLEGHWLKLPSP